MKNKFYVIAMTSICTFLGIIIGIQYNTVKKNASVVEVQRVAELTGALKKVQDEKNALEEELKAIQLKHKAYEESMAKQGLGASALKEELDHARNVAGFTELKGRGVTVTLRDSRNANQNGGDINAYLVHAEDILSIINELNVAGAEAISVNGQRIIGSSSVRCVGSVVNINGVKVAAPFVFTAIGDSDILESALIFPGGVVDSLSPWGIEIVIKKNASVTVPAYILPIQYKEAKQVQKGEGGL